MLERVRSAEPEVRRDAFGQVVTAYWKPIYKYLRLKWRLEDDDAADATQGFLARAFEKEFFDSFDPARARFRTFLRVCVDRFVMNERQAAQAQRRGGGAQAVSLDFVQAEAEMAHHAGSTSADPDQLFHREVLRDLVSRALDDVRAACEAQGRRTAWLAFERYDIEPADGVTYATLARELGEPVTQITNYLSALRRQFRARLLERLREMCGSDAEFRAEARELLGAEIP